MKVVIVWSSPNENGLTASAKESFLSGLKKAGTEYEEVHLNKFKTEHCLACGNGWGTCRSEGRCIIKDDFESITPLYNSYIFCSEIGSNAAVG